MQSSPFFREDGLTFPSPERVGQWLSAAANWAIATAPLTIPLFLSLLRASAAIPRAIVTWRGWNDVFGLTFMLGLVLYYFRDAIIDGRIFYENDTAAFYYPLTQRYAQGLAAGELPLWIRTIFGGFPLFADSETGMLYPVNILLLSLLPVWEAFVWQRIVNFVLGAWFMYGFGRALGFRPFSAAIASTVFTFGSFLMAQQHHANILGTAVWLPASFFAIEMAFRSDGRRRFQWLALGGLAVGIQCMAVHVQIVLLTLLALLLYVGFRFLLGPVRVRLAPLPLSWAASPLRRLLLAAINVWLAIAQRGAAAMGAAFLVVLLGLGVGAVQLLSLSELANYSYRSFRVDYSFASTYAMPPLGVLQLLQPQLLMNGLLTGQSTLNWESTLYVGAPTLVLALIGALCARDRRALFFFALALLSIAAAMGPNSPGGLHHFLWELPGFSAMRAAGRFTLLAVFGFAVTAGFGAHFLDERLSRWSPLARLYAWRSGWFALFLGLLILTPGLLLMASVIGRPWIEANPGEALRLFSIRLSPLIGPDLPALTDQVLQRIRAALDIANPRLMLTLVLLQATVVLVTVWYGAPRLGVLCKSSLLALLVIDLVGFGSALHPTMTHKDMLREPDVAYYLGAQADGERVLVKNQQPRSLEANRLMQLGVPVIGGYSSLSPQRQLEYVNMLRGGWDNFPDVLLDTASVRYIAARARFTGLPFYDMVSFDPAWPLTQGGVGNAGARVTFDGGLAKGDTIGVVAALRHGVDIPQGATLAEITVVTDRGERITMPLQAGVHASEWAYDRWDVAGKTKHAKATVAFVSTEGPQDEQFKANFSYAQLPLGRIVTARTVEYKYVHPAGSLRLYGMSLFDRSTATIAQIRKKPKYRLLYQDSETMVYENVGALPRAYVVPQGIEVPTNSKALDVIMEGNFDPRQMVLLEDPAKAGIPSERQASASPLLSAAIKYPMVPADVLEARASTASVRYIAPETGWLVFTDSYYPGWRAYIDGQETPIYRANYLFRAVRVPQGEHSVEFRFVPQSFVLGMQITLLSIGAALMVLVLPEVYAYLRALALWVARKSGLMAAVRARLAAIGS